MIKFVLKLIGHAIPNYLLLTCRALLFNNAKQGKATNICLPPICNNNIMNK